MKYLLPIVFSFFLCSFLYGFFSPSPTYAYRINLFKIDGQSAQLRNNGSFVKGDPVLVEINEVDITGNDSRWLAVFNSFEPKHPDPQIRIFNNGFFCEAAVADDPDGRWSVGTDSRNPPERFGEPYCDPEEILHLYLSTDGSFSCGSGGNAACTIRISKKNQQFVNGEDPGPKTETSQTFKMPEGVTTTIPVVSLSQSVLTAGEPLTLSISSVLPRTTYDMKVTFENDTSQNFGTASFTTGAGPSCGDKGKLQNTNGQRFSVGRRPSDQVEWCIDNSEYYIQLNTAGYRCEGTSTQSKCLIQVVQRDNPQLSGPNQSIFSVVGTQIQFSSIPQVIDWGGKQNILIIKIPKMTSRDATYTVTLAKNNGSKVASYTFKVKKNDNNSDGCDVSDGGKILITKPENTACYYNTSSNKDTFSNYAVLDTSKLSQPTGRINDRSGQISGLADIYKISVSIDDSNKDLLPQTLTKSFYLQFNTQKAKLILKPTAPYDGEIKDTDRQLKDINKSYEYEIYENTDVEVELRGCPPNADKEKGAGFIWFRGSQDIKEVYSKLKTATFQQTLDEYDNWGLTHQYSDKTKVAVGSDGIARFTHQFDADNDGTTAYLIRAWCLADPTSPVVGEALFRTHGKGNEFLSVPVDILANKDFDITAGGLEENECYYIKIKDKNTDEWITQSGSSITCNESDNRIDDSARTEAYAASSDWSPSHKITVTGGLERGEYIAQLWIVDSENSKNRKDNQKVEIPICVEVCRNDGQAYPPGKAPCLIGLAEDGKTLIDARPREDREKNPVEGATAGSRDQIQTCEVVPTAFGNIKLSPESVVKSLLQLMLSVAGGIALILILIAGYKLMTSRGNPEQVQDAREQLTSAIVGLLFIIFSVVILEIIGVDLLHIPGFTR